MIIVGNSVVFIITGDKRSQIQIQSVMSQPAEIETFPALRIVAYGAAILFSSGETKRGK